MYIRMVQSEDCCQYQSTHQENEDLYGQEEALKTLLMQGYLRTLCKKLPVKVRNIFMYVYRLSSLIQQIFALLTVTSTVLGTSHSK